MPTTAKLVAAVLLAALGWFSAELVKPYLDPSQPVGLFSPVSAGFGLALGWVFTGRRLQARQGTGVGIGIASAALLVFWVTLAFSGYEMITRSMRLAYDGPVEALQSMVDIGIEYLKTAAQADVIAALVVGGIAVGSITQWTVRRFR
jgi:hypothetical protein